MTENQKQNNLRPPPPGSGQDDGPEEWVVVTQVFNGAADIGLYQSSKDSTFALKSREGEERACALVGYYDADYGSLHVDRYFEDGERERVYNPSCQTRPMEYSKILDLMEFWQSAAAHNNRKNGEAPARDFAEVFGDGDEEFDRIPYQKTPKPL